MTDYTALLRKLDSFEPDEPEGVLCRHAAKALRELQAKLELADKELDHKMRLQISFEGEIDDLKDRLSEVYKLKELLRSCADAFRLAVRTAEMDPGERAFYIEKIYELERTLGE
jgi:hypothetical protein